MLDDRLNIDCSGIHQLLMLITTKIAFNFIMNHLNFGLPFVHAMVHAWPNKQIISNNKNIRLLFEKSKVE